MHNENRIIRYDYLRIISMLIVVLYHYTTRYNELFGHNNSFIIIPSECATIAVSLFLIMTGFFSYKSINNNANTPVLYLKKRLIRLLPTYWLALTLTTIILLIATEQKITVIQYFTNLLLVNRFINIPFIDGAYWYMTIIIVYTIFSTLAILIRNKNKNLLFKMYAFLYIIVGIIQFKFNCIPHIISFLLFQYLNKCLVGYFVFKIINNKQKYDICFIMILLFGEYFLLDHKMIICDLIAFIIFIIVERDLIPFSNIKSKYVYKSISILSFCSYFIYLFHQQFGYAVISILESIHINSIIAIAITVIIVLIISIIYYYMYIRINNYFKKLID